MYRVDSLGSQHGSGRRAPRWIRATLTVATAAAAALAGAAGCSGGPASGVTVAAVGYGTVAQVVQAPANVVPKDQVTLGAAADGAVAGLDVQDGQQVAAGQVLGTISSPAAQQQLASAQLALSQASSGDSGIPATTTGFTSATASDQTAANTAFAQAKSAAQQIADPTLQQTLLDEINAAQSSYDSAISTVDGVVSQFEQGLASAGQVLDALDEAQRTQAQAAVDTAQSTVNALTVTAPISGTVTLDSGQGGSGSSGLGSISQLISQAESGSSAAGSAGSGSGSGSSGSAGAAGGAAASGGSTMISVGTPVSAGNSLFTITDASALTVAAQVDETDVLTVHPGVTADIQLNAVPGATYPATVTAVDPTAVTSTQGNVTYTVRLSLGTGKLQDGEAAPTPLPGMSAIANLDVVTAHHTLSVPSSALIINGQTTSVWLVSGGAAQLHPITLGAQGQTVVQVLSGLKAGDRIVVNGADKVTAGEKVG